MLRELDAVTGRRTIVKSNRLLVLSIVAAIVAASCGAADSPTDGGAVSTPGTVSRPDEFGVATFTLDPDNPPSPDNAALHLLATERACASGQAPVYRQVLPVIVEHSDAVEITVLVQEPVGSQTCQGNPAFLLTVQLSGPLGDRVIRDAAFFPAEERPWPLQPRASRLALQTAGDRPAPGTANVVAWSGESSEALLFGAAGWSSEPTWFQSFEGEPPTTISGFVTSCDDTAGCEEECEGADCDALPRLGAECTMAYTPIPGQDTTMTVHFTGTSCTIEVTTDPID